MTEPIKKRKRIALSCDNCRKKKTKCDRSFPCSNCVKLSIGHTCSFSSPDHINHHKSINQSDQSHTYIDELERLKSKIKLLEGSIGNSKNSQSQNILARTHHLSPRDDASSNLSSTISSDSLESPDFQSVWDGSKHLFAKQVEEQSKPLATMGPGASHASGPPINEKPSSYQHYSDTKLPKFTPCFIEAPIKSQKPLLKEILSPADVRFLVDSNDHIRQNNKEWYLGINPMIPDTTFFNLHFTIDASNFTRPAIPPLPLRFLVRRDPGCSLLWKHHEPITKTLFNFPSIGTSKGSELLAGIAKNKLGNPMIKQIEDGYSLGEVKQSCSNFAKDTGVFFHPQNLSKQTLLENLLALLPKPSVCRKYLDLFFENLYVFFPIIDEFQFRGDVHKIFEIVEVEDPYENDFKRIVIEKKQDLATISIYLFILRLTFISQFRFSSSISGDLREMNMFSTSGSAFANDNPISMEIADIAEECLKTFNYSRRQELVVLQGALFSRIHDRYSPDSGDKPSGDPACTAILIQMASQLGLHRDPDYLMEFNFSDSQKLLRRKIWHFLVSLDIYDTIFYGTPMTARVSSYDTKLPYLIPGVSNTKNENIEKEAIKNFQILRPVVLATSKMAELLSTIKDQVPMAIIIEQMSDFELVVAKICENLTSLLTVRESESHAFRVKMIHTYLHSKMFLVGMYYYFFTYYHDKEVKQLEFFYLKKTLVTIFGELHNLMRTIINKENDGVARALALLVTPIVNLINSFTCMITLSLCIRLTATSKTKEIINDTNLSNDKQKLLKKLMHYTAGCTKDLMHNLSITGKRFITAWKARKAMFHGLNILLNGPTLKVSAPSSSLINYEYDQLRQLNDIFVKYTRSGATPEIEIPDVLQSFQSMNFELAEESKLDEKNVDYMISEMQLDQFWRQMSNIRYATEQEWLRSLEPKGISNTTTDTNFMPSAYTSYFPDFDLFESSIMDTFGEL